MSLMIVIVLAAVHFHMLGLAFAEDHTLASGLRAEYFAAVDPGGPPEAVRVDRDIAFDWGGDSPDLRLGPGPFSARWTGILFVPDDGDFRFLLRLSGTARVLVGGRVVVEGARSEEGWIDGAPVALEFGHHDIEVEYRKTASAARMALYWEAPQIGLEPIRGDHLFRRGSDAIDGRFEQGLRLMRRLGCAACHQIAGVGRGPAAPSLRSVTGSRRAAHLVQKLLDPRRALPGSRMPSFRLDERQARAITRALIGDATDREAAPPRSDAKVIEHGRRRVLASGCLACHSVGDHGGAGVTRIALDGAGDRWTVAGLRRWLSPPRDPEDRAAHRPEVGLTGDALDEVVGFLGGLLDGDGDGNGNGNGNGDEDEDEDEDEEVVRLIEALRCGACHEMPADIEQASAPDAPALDADTDLDGERSCLEPGRAATRRPYFPLSAPERAAVEVFLREVAPGASLARFEVGRLLLEERGCVSCHRRGGDGGLDAVIASLAAGESRWRGREGALRPPDITAAGDKLTDSGLRDAVSGRVRRRPWLEVRMPRFHHTPEEEAAILHFLATHDRVPPRGEGPSDLPPRGDLFVAGHRLVGAGGFSCVACHTVGSYTPEGVAPNVRGPDVVGIGEFVRRDWFVRWMRDPGRMAPGIEMPAIAAPFPGILGEDRELQLHALWVALNAPEFSAPAHSATVREVAVPSGEPEMIHDVFKWRPPFGEGWTPRTLAVAFPNGHTIALDLSIAAPVAWWQDGLARQFTQGKFWFWEPAGAPIVPRFPAFHSVAMRHPDGRIEVPVRVDQTTGWVESWERTDDGGVAVVSRLRLGEGRWVRTREKLTPIERRSPGIARRLEVDSDGGDLSGEPLAVLALPASASPRVAGRTVSLESVSGRVEISTSAASGWTVLDEPPGAPAGAVVVATPLDADGGESAVEMDLALASNAPLPPRPSIPRGLEPSNLETLDLVPGFDAVRLPLTRAVMPTAIAFSSDGRAFVTSLDGVVHALRDDDGDGIEDRCESVARYLSAPFGVLVDGRDLIVSHKPELIRLVDRDRDGFFERHEVIATGWGFSHDYHDWTFGLVERDGEYLVLTGSDYQQKGRRRETTMFRGKALRIGRDGSVRVVARGLRFTVGLAANADGEVFFTDNQGENNTFNELNHLREGRLYGVPGLHDPADDRKRTGEPPAIQLPHPWTRSVNGIVFLPVDENAFGPFAGHGIGCEYDNRKLIRFTVQRVGDTYQGACYPMTRDAKGADRLLGPICAAVSPTGDIYVGSMKESGWGGGNNVGDIVRLRKRGPIPFGVREMRAIAGGFEVLWTSPCDPNRAALPESYTISAYRRVWKGGYATPDSDRHGVRVERAEVHDDHLGVRLHATPVREGFVFEVRVGDVGPGGGRAWPGEGYLTLNRGMREGE